MVAIAGRIEIPETDLRAFCERWRVVRLSVFGSALRNDFKADSDLDVLAEFEPDARHTIFDVLHMEEEFAALAGRPVDFVEWKGVEQSPNYLRRGEILGSSRVFFDVG